MKGSRQANQQGNHQTTISVNSQNTTVESADLLIKNTLQNELITYENITNQRMIAENSHHSEEVCILFIIIFNFEKNAIRVT